MDGIKKVNIDSEYKNNAATNNASSNYERKGNTVIETIGDLFLGKTTIAQQDKVNQIISNVKSDVEPILSYDNDGNTIVDFTYEDSQNYSYGKTGEIYIINEDGIVVQEDVYISGNLYTGGKHQTFVTDSKGNVIKCIEETIGLIDGNGHSGTSIKEYSYVKGSKIDGNSITYSEERPVSEYYKWTNKFGRENEISRSYDALGSLEKEVSLEDGKKAWEFSYYPNGKSNSSTIYLNDGSSMQCQGDFKDLNSNTNVFYSDSNGNSITNSEFINKYKTEYPVGSDLAESSELIHNYIKPYLNIN